MKFKGFVYKNGIDIFYGDRSYEGAYRGTVLLSDLGIYLSSVGQGQELDVEITATTKLTPLERTASKLHDAIETWNEYNVHNTDGSTATPSVETITVWLRDIEAAVKEGENI